LVWKPSSQEFPGPSCVLSAPSPNSRMLLAIMSIKPVPIGSYRDQTSLLFYSLSCVALGKSCLSTCRHPHSLAQSSYIMSLYIPTLLRMHLLEAAEKYNIINYLKKYYHLPCPHKGMVVSVQLGQLAEHVVIWTHSLDTSSLDTQPRHR
jgi:hypothetical protein